MNDVRFYTFLIVTNAAAPIVLLLIDAFTGRLGANPIEYFLRATGVLALIALLAGLLVTPLRKILGWNGLIKHRRAIGLIAFAYAAIHLVTYSVFDKSLDAGLIAKDVWQRPFIAVGMAAFLMLVPLAATSTNGMIKRLGGKNWARLHKLVYPIAVLGVVHFWMIVKSDLFYPAIFAAVLTLLLGYRLYPALRSRGALPARAAGNRISGD